MCARVLVSQLCPLFMIPWTATLQAPLFMEFSRQEHCTGQPFQGSQWMENGQERSVQKRQCLLGLASRRAEPGRGNLVQVIYRQRSEEARQEMRGVRQNRRPSWVPAGVQLSSQGAPWREWGLHQSCLSLSRRGQTSVLLPASHWLRAASQG